jgi:two-component system, sensor histidine kinase and response regulator
VIESSAKSPVKFLLVDDLAENLLALEALLAREDLILLQARSGREALELLLSHDVALALIDVHMPEMDGFELAELMRGVERTRHVPIIFVTAGMRETHRVFQGYDAGAVDFLFKPIEPQILRHKAETFFQLYRQRQALADTLRLNEELIAVVGHDLRNPLDVILMTAELMRESTQDAQVLKSAQRLHKSGTRMRQIIEELLDMSRARLGGGIPIQRRSVDLFTIAKTAVAEAEAAHPERRIELRSDGDMQGKWDGGRLEQVLSNLLGNALRHGASESPVVVQLTAETDLVTVSVHNQGHINPELLPRIFDPFQTTRASRGQGDGLGLGLYIVQQIVASHAGEVEVRSEPDDGTTFVVRLPRRPSTVVAQPSAD